MGAPSNHRSKGKIFVAKNESFLEKEFLSKDVSGRKVELDKVICTFSQIGKLFITEISSVIATPISEEANDDDHETSNQVTTEPRRYSRVRSALV